MKYIILLVKFLLAFGVITLLQIVFIAILECFNMTEFNKGFYTALFVATLVNVCLELMK